MMRSKTASRNALPAPLKKITGTAPHAYCLYHDAIPSIFTHHRHGQRCAAGLRNESGTGGPARGIETSDEWIATRTGIRQRYFAAPEAMTSDLALTASKNALRAADIDLQSIDLIIIATSTPDFVLPSTACALQRKLGLRNHCIAFDLQAACTGFVYALTIADQFIRARACQTALVVGAEIFSRLLDFNDRSTCVLFGDGAGAVVLQASEQAGVISSALHADGRHTDILCAPGRVSGGAICGQAFVTMDG